MNINFKKIAIVALFSLMLYFIMCYEDEIYNMDLKISKLKR